jgi:hypothetical protein
MSFAEREPPLHLYPHEPCSMIGPVQVDAAPRRAMRLRSQFSRSEPSIGVGILSLSASNSGPRTLPSDTAAHFQVPFTLSRP